MSDWTTSTYACEKCGNRYTTSTYGQPAQVLGKGTITTLVEPQPTIAAHCSVDGGRFLLVAPTATKQ